MRDFESGLTADRLRDVLRYSPETGLFHWRVMCSARRPAEMLAGDKKKDSGYVLIGVDCVRYRAHRLAWLYMTGQWPALQVDHIDGDRSNNRWVNLREATQRQNSANMRRRDSNRCGVKGVSIYRGDSGYVSYRANICLHNKTHYLGCFQTAEEAQAAYAEAAREHFGEFARAA